MKESLVNFGRTLGTLDEKFDHKPMELENFESKISKFVELEKFWQIKEGLYAELDGDGKVFVQI